ncbi:DNA recombination protein RmuC [Streptococcus sp. DD12]|uniref:DNA recombination protein RmuC n=1 Tax=Streptococcus sp. DD12 TaxID=1777880 RepID=UPI00079CD2C5|nr:DNA recombination protein RmuC [Streptococcus sp. DD12]KXT75279.1 DNA recombination protein RmuC [Streptococcus sp. DD12]
MVTTLLVIVVLLVCAYLLWEIKQVRKEQEEAQKQQEIALLNQMETVLVREQMAQSRLWQNEMAKVQTLIYQELNEGRDRSDRSLESVRQTLQTSVDNMQSTLQDQLAQMRETVNEKLESTLQSRLRTSFASVSQQLERVNKSLGEMQHLSQDVASLNRTLAGTKTRGIMGEVQLARIVEEILAPGQYEREVPTVPKSANRVEFAIKMPGEKTGEWVYLPVDSKFPLESYQRLEAAFEAGDKPALEKARKELGQSLKSFAKDIHSKYIHPPQTTPFGILFLPTEGLYAEALRQVTIVEDLRRHENVIIAGPSTLAALLNALTVGFRTLSIQQNTAEISKILGNVKLEFNKFADLLQKAQKQLGLASGHIDKLLTTRTNAIARALSQIETYQDEETQALLSSEPLENEEKDED